jgi:primosomal protein N' (replication factor Y)
MSVASDYAEVLLPLPLEGTFTYLIPELLKSDIHTGQLVIIPFGSGKFFAGIVLGFTDKKPVGFRIKEIYGFIVGDNLVNDKVISFWKWIAEYYMCTLGEVMKAAMPSGFRLEGTDAESIGFPENRKEIFVRLTDKMLNDAALLDLTESALAKAKKQHEVLLKYFELSGFEHNKEEILPVLRKNLVTNAGSNYDAINSLCKKGILEYYERETMHLSTGNTVLKNPSVLNEFQVKALASVKNNFLSKKVCLLYGYTSSGKTEIYIHLIMDCLSSGRNALFLVPEIALTTQLSERLKDVFGEKLGIYHSNISEQDKAVIWKKISSDEEPMIILGARSSVFLPFNSLGLIIVDEEHDGSYKQQDPAPRYHARNSAIVLSSFFEANTLLGTATPSMESYANALSGKYGLTELFNRYSDTELPEIKVIDVKDLKKRKKMKSILSPVLIEEMTKSFDTGKQVILFQNRRGYSQVLQCRDCGWIPKCRNCDVTLTFHKSRDKVCCHYCSTEYDVPFICPDCGGMNLKFSGIGTEQIEEVVKQLFPEKKTSRLDTDTTKSKNSFERIIDDFEDCKTDVLIGTQMVSKGLDFSKVKVAGIVNADQMINFPDFRANERAFQLMAQVSGRAGRSGSRGKVILQTTQPDNHVIQHVVSNDFNSFFEEEAAIRKAFNYPPFSRIIKVYFKHRDQDVVRNAALSYTDKCSGTTGFQLLGPDQPSVSRISGLYLQALIIKMDIRVKPNDVKQLLLSVKDEIKQNALFKNVQFVFDVDPV